MDEKKIYCGQGLPRAPKLGGIFFQGRDSVGRENDVAIVMGGFARIATQEKLLHTICKNLEIDSFLFDWHGLGMSEGNFGDVTVERLKEDLKRVVGMLYAEGYQHFHLVGHSLGACVVAFFCEESAGYIDIRKKIFIAPAFDQAYLLRYWFARERGLSLEFEDWSRKFEDNCSLLHSDRGGRTCNFSKCWDHEREFEAFAWKEKTIKGIEFLPDYWLRESSMNYAYCLDYEGNILTAVDDEAFIIAGEHDQVIPIESIDFGTRKKYLIDADHDMIGSEEEVAYYVNESI